ncbi:MAG TPA: SAM-dependent chlorinase/fluorinase [Burkholderiales bacterium]|nr:SAM-dependent chlorinase/fluorinase [Burkholderiales bacterium]
MIILFTDFGARDLYAGQVKAVLHHHAPGVRQIDLLHDAPAFNVKTSAHLLAALSQPFPKGSVFLAVVDPSVGTAREAVAMTADGKWFVGPDNGLLSVLAARAEKPRFWHISWRPQNLSHSFHGRDLFAPIAALVAQGVLPLDKMEEINSLRVQFGAPDLAEIIYIDHYGNAMSGLRAKLLAPDGSLLVNGARLKRARVFAEVPSGTPFWYENCLGLAEIAVNSSSAAVRLDLEIGDKIELVK